MQTSIDAGDDPAPGRRPDELEGAVDHTLPMGTLRELSRVTGAISAAHIAAEWGLIVAAAWACSRHLNPLSYLVAVMFIGARQHALVILMHDGAHYRLFRNRKVNDWVSEVFLAWPFLVPLRGYRAIHFAHHRHVNSGGDPDWTSKLAPDGSFTRDWRFPKTRWEMARLILKDVLGVNLFFLILLKRRYSSGKSTRLLFHAAALAALVYFGLIVHYLMYWLVPLLTWFMTILHLRSIAEHHGMPPEVEPRGRTRTTILSWFDRIFIVSKNINFHVEHHLFPSVPFHRLRELHAQLMERPAYRDGVHLTRGYLGVVRECVAVAPPGAASARAPRDAEA